MVKIVIKYEREYIENNDGQNEMGKTRGKCGDDNIKGLPPKDKCLRALWLQCVKFMRGKGDKYDAITKEMPCRWFNTKTTSELLVINPMKFSWQCVKHMMDERNGKPRGVIQGN